MTADATELLIQSVEAAVSEQVSETEQAEFGAIAAMSQLEIAEERLGLAVQTLTRTTAALRVLRGLSAPLPAPQAAPALSPAAPATKPVVLPGRPDTGEPGDDAVPQAASKRSGPQCPGCGDFGTIVRNEGYKGTPYTVLVCSSCGWERNV